MLEKDIYECMELSKQSYFEVILMPVKRFRNYLKWKEELEAEKEKLIMENQND